MIVKLTGDAKLLDKAVLQAVIGTKHNRRYTCHIRRCYALRKMPLYKGRTGHRQIGHLTQQQTTCAGHRLLCRTQTGRHLAAAHAPQAHILIFNLQVQQHAFPLAPG